MAEQRFFRRIAFVYPNEMHAELDFLVLAAGNRGVKVRLFEVMDEALHWVGADPS